VVGANLFGSLNTNKSGKVAKFLKLAPFFYRVCYSITHYGRRQTCFFCRETIEGQIAASAAMYATDADIDDLGKIIQRQKDMESTYSKEKDSAHIVQRFIDY